GRELLRNDGGRPDLPAVRDGPCLRRARMCLRGRGRGRTGRRQRAEEHHPRWILGHRERLRAHREDRGERDQVQREHQRKEPEHPPPEAAILAAADRAEERRRAPSARVEHRRGAGERERGAHGVAQARRRLWYTLVSITNAGCCGVSLFSWTSAMSRSNSVARWPESRTRLCTQKNEARRSPRVTGRTWCRLPPG